MTVAVHHSRPGLGVKKKNVPRVLERAKLIYNSMLASIALFASPTVLLSKLLAQIEALDLAEQAAKTKAKGTIPVRDGQRDALWTSLLSLQTYVDGLCADSPGESTILIAKAGMVVEHVGTYEKKLLNATNQMPGGTVLLAANEHLLTGGTTKAVTFHWQWSGDNGKTWNDARSTPLAHKLLLNLPLAADCWFRVSVTISETDGAWSEHVTLFVK